MEKVKVCTCFHMIIATIIVVFMHPFLIIFITNIIQGFLKEIWFETFPLFTLLAAYGASYLYLKKAGVEGYKRKALVATLTGSLILLGSCFALVCSMSNYPTGW